MTVMDLHPRSLDFGIDDLLRHAAHEYRLELGWTTTVDGNQLTLELDDYTWGIQLPTSLAEDLVTALHAMHLSCPVIALPDRQNPRSVVLLEPDERPESVPPFPTLASMLPAGHRVPLPPSITARGPVRWLHEPNGIARPTVRVIAHLLTRLGQGTARAS